MTHLFKILLGLLLLPFCITSQTCPYKVPNDVTVLSENTNGVVQDQKNWICTDIAINASGNDNIWIVSVATDINIAGNEDTLFVTEGAVVNLSGNDHVIYVTASGKLDLVGNDNQVFHEDGAQLDINGLENVVTPCDTVLLDVSHVALNDCHSVSTYVAELATIDVLFYPNPVSNHLNISGQWKGLADLKIYSSIGRLVAAYRVADRSSVLLPKGIQGFLWIELSTSEQRATQKILVQ